MKQIDKQKLLKKIEKSLDVLLTSIRTQLDIEKAVKEENINE